MPAKGSARLKRNTEGARVLYVEVVLRLFRHRKKELKCSDAKTGLQVSATAVEALESSLWSGTKAAAEWNTIWVCVSSVVKNSNL
jgi:hypothetical protein